MFIVARNFELRKTALVLNSFTVHYLNLNCNNVVDLFHLEEYTLKNKGQIWSFMYKIPTRTSKLMIN